MSKGPLKPALAGGVSAMPLILTPFGEYEARCRAIDAAADERQAAIAESAAQLVAAVDSVERSRDEAKAVEFTKYQAALKASH